MRSANRFLIVIPTESEFAAFVNAMTQMGYDTGSREIGRLAAVDFPDLNSSGVLGGHGKSQFAVQTQHAIQATPGITGVICAGLAGSLDEMCSVGDVVVATETVEHDMVSWSGRPAPRFPSSPALVDIFYGGKSAVAGHEIHFGPIASGDEDVTSVSRRKSIHAATGALAVAWEGAGGARAAQFSGVPYLEVRGVSDTADGEAIADFGRNLPRAMTNVAGLLAACLGPGADR